MNVYHYDSATGVLTGSGVAFPDPLTPNAFLLPAYATFVAPPVFNAETQQAVFANGVWAVQNIPAPPAPPAPTLSEAQAAQIATLQADYSAAISQAVNFTNAAGVASTYPAGNTVALNGRTAMQNLAYVLDAGAPAWTLGKWLDTRNIAQTFTFADLQGLAAAMEAQETVDWTGLVAKVAEVQAATTVAAVQAITW